MRTDSMPAERPFDFAVAVGVFGIGGAVGDLDGEEGDAGAMRSMPEWRPSESMPREPVRRPVRSLRRVTPRAARTEKSAAERLALWEVAASSGWAVVLMEEMVQGWDEDVTVIGANSSLMRVIWPLWDGWRAFMQGYGLVAW